MFTTIQVKTNHHDEMVDITRRIKEVLKESGVEEGVCTVFIPHTTCAVTINENADPDVVRDMVYELNKIVPWEDGYHHFEGNTAAHIKSSMMGFSEQIIVHKGELILGTWQGIYLCEYDGPRLRKVHIRL